MVILLDGKSAQAEKREALKEKIASLSKPISLVIIQVGDKEESNAYIAQKKKFGEFVGVNVAHIRLSEAISEDELISSIDKYNKDGEMDGILVQLPIPELIDKRRVANSIDFRKDVDGLSDVNMEKLRGGGKGHIPATARGIFELIKNYGFDVRGKKIAVLGKSLLVGTPTALLFKREGGDVTVCDSKTENTKEITKQSDIVIVAIGKPNLIGKDYFRDDKTQIVIDVGITAITERGEEHLEEEIPQKKLVGDVNFEEVKDMVKAISPVPGGVGPMTVLSLFENLLDTTNL